jgi:serine phosphatase RsbU (regulator of sigma subunit)
MGPDPLGIFSAAVLQPKDLNLASGDRFFLYTDGLIEATLLFLKHSSGRECTDSSFSLIYARRGTLRRAGSDSHDPSLENWSQEHAVGSHHEGSRPKLRQIAQPASIIMADHSFFLVFSAQQG